MISESVAKYLGMKDDPEVMEVEKGAIKRYADAVEDYNPLYFDEEYARNSKYGAIITPPGFFGWAVKPGPKGGLIQKGIVDEMQQAGYFIMDGGCEFEFYRPIRAGDILVGQMKIAEMTEKEGRTGQMLFVITELTYTNQNGQLAAKRRQTLIGRLQPASS